eukprot:s2142_g22.t1
MCVRRVRAVPSTVKVLPSDPVVLEDFVLTSPFYGNVLFLKNGIRFDEEEEEDDDDDDDDNDDDDDDDDDDDNDDDDDDDVDDDDDEDNDDDEWLWAMLEYVWPIGWLCECPVTGYQGIGHPKGLQNTIWNPYVLLVTD